MIMQKITICLALLITSLHAMAADKIKPFTSDGCSAFPDGTIAQQQLWLACCVAHDLAYWQGGTYQQRVQADQNLRQCVEQVGEPTIAVLMLAGVRVGGTPYLPTPFRWGYGWPYPRGYKAVSAAEQHIIQAQLDNAKHQPEQLLK